MNMKILNHIALIAATAAMMLVGCAEDNTPNTANKGKEKPTVEVELTDNTDTEFNLKVTSSSNTKYFGYVVYDGKDNEVPSAYDIVTGNLANYLDFKLFENDGSAKDAVVKCILNDDYQVFAAAITETGLLGEVSELNVNIEGAHPEIELVEGVYTITPYPASEEDEYEPTDAAQEPFNVTVSKLNAAQYLVTGKWFGFATLSFVASFDFNDNSLVMDGRVYSQGSISSSSWFGGLIGYTNSARTLAWALFGAGSNGTDPMIFDCDVKDKKASLVSVRQGIDIEIYNYSAGTWNWNSTIGWFFGGEKITYVGSAGE